MLKSEYVLYLLIGVWYFLQTPIFRQKILEKFADYSPNSAWRRILKIFPKSAFLSDDLSADSNSRDKKLILFGKIAVISVVAIKIIKAVISTALQHQRFWPYFKPPYQPISYFLQYAWTNFWLKTVLAFFVALIIFLFIKTLNQKYQERFFYKEEYYFAAFGTLALGWPWSLLYFSIVFLFGIIGHLIVNPIIIKKIKFSYNRANMVSGETSEAGQYRLSFYYIWLPLAIGGIIIMLFK